MQENDIDIELWRRKQIVSKVDVNPAIIKRIAFFHRKIHNRHLKGRPGSYGHGSKAFNTFRVLIIHYRSNLFAAFVSKKLSIGHTNG